jgi:hypothetical protein
MTVHRVSQSMILSKPKNQPATRCTPHRITTGFLPVTLHISLGHAVYQPTLLVSLEVPVLVFLTSVLPIKSFSQPCQVSERKVSWHILYAVEQARIGRISFILAVIKPYVDISLLLNQLYYDNNKWSWCNAFGLGLQLGELIGQDSYVLPSSSYHSLLFDNMVARLTNKSSTLACEVFNIHLRFSARQWVIQHLLKNTVKKELLSLTDLTFLHPHRAVSFWLFSSMRNLKQYLPTTKRPLNTCISHMPNKQMRKSYVLE